MCATVLAQPITMTTPFVRKARCQDSTFKPVENGNGQGPLSRQWVVVTDEHGTRRLRMRWTAAPFFSPSRIGKAAGSRFEPVAGRLLDAITSPQPQIGTS